MERYGLNLDRPEILRAILTRIVETGDVIGRAGPGRTVLAVAVDDWVVDELAAVGGGGSGAGGGASGRLATATAATLSQLLIARLKENITLAGLATDQMRLCARVDRRERGLSTLPLP